MIVINSGVMANSPPDESAFQERLRHLEEELRCLVCQNQSLADSNAELALDLRREIRQLANQGKTDAEIVHFLKERYGDFVSYRPPFKMSTLFLWIGPPLFLGIALIWVLIVTRRRRVKNSLSSENENRARYLLGLEEDDP